jgi:hypothetical protein
MNPNKKKKKLNDKQKTKNTDQWYVFKPDHR